jgi:hypothetical protein
MSGIMERRRSRSDHGGSAPKKHHVFLFRHCVRSTDTQVNLYNSTNSSSVPLSDFWPPLVRPEVIPPNWNVPTNWCTEQSVQQMQDTGTYVYDTFLRFFGGGDRRPLQFRFLSDTAQRDADSALALQKGVALAFSADPTSMNNTFSASNLFVTEYVPLLYNPFSATSISSPPICSLQVTPNQWQQEVQTRLDSIASPPLSMLDTLKLLQLINENDPQLKTSNYPSTLLFDVNIGPRLSGMINVIKLAVQTMFYSRAAGVKPLRFLQRITNAQIYQQLLPWVHYSRSILNVGTTEAASRGAVLLRTIVDALESPNETTTENRVTFLVGHDTDLDAVATALDVFWAFDAPYYTAEARVDWYATPPGSAMYITHEAAENDSIVTLSYLYPIFNLTDGTILSWESIPLQLRNSSFDNSNIRMDKRATTVTWTRFQEQFQTTLQRYMGAMDCYNRAADLSASKSNISDSAILDSDPWKTFGGVFGTGVAVSILFAFLSGTYKIRRLRRLRSLYSTANSVHFYEEEFDTACGSIRKVPCR